MVPALGHAPSVALWPHFHSYTFVLLFNSFMQHQPTAEDEDAELSGL